ncbi:hypothetical protein TNCV_5097661 [Trichonephila clavipes]|nr:hypothetical protein TNCV_5097661 [Trichonephila clavipes]
MLYNDQTVKITDVLMLRKSVDNVASIVGYNLCNTLRLLFVVQACTTPFRLAIDRENKQDNESIQYDGQRTIRHCVPRVVAHYPLGIWLMAMNE